MPKDDQHILENLYGLTRQPIIQEGFMSIPEKVYRPIKDYYIENWKLVKSKGIKRLSLKSFPIKNFVLDFSGTQYEHLNKLSPKLSVDIRLSAGSSSYYRNDQMRSNKGFIQLDFNDAAQSIYSTIEHEISHLVQHALERYKKRILKHKNATIGGIPKSDLLNPDLTLGGVKKDSGSGRRVLHGHRPVEYYPDLLSSVRELQYKFFKKYGDNSNWDKIKNSESLKKEFFMDFYNSIKSTESPDKPDVAWRTFKQFKTVSKAFYVKMLSYAYDALVNRDWNFDPAEIKSIYKDVNMGLIKKSVDRIRGEKPYTGPVRRWL